MSFYGNISNMSRTSFQFERTYSSRVLMDASAQTDGVFVGNYVLVDYDTEMQSDWGIECYAYRNADNPEVIEFYMAPRGEGVPRIKYQQLLVSSTLYPYARSKEAYFKYLIVPGNRTSTNTTTGEVVTTKYNFVDGDGVDHDVIYEVYGHIGTGTDSSYWYPLVKKLTEESSIYARNAAIDKSVYDTVRGFDSTVWQKVYTGNPPQGKYVMIAELNSIVPTFDVTPEAPTMSPIAPHFDTGSTNFYYNLHWQPGWGMRVKSAINVTADPNIVGLSGVAVGSASIPLNFNPIIGQALPSDETIRWTRPFYDKATNAINTYTYTARTDDFSKLTVDGAWQIGDPGHRGDLPAAIYYNKAGFNSEISIYSQEGIKDEIAITPSGLSGLAYHQHGARYVPLSTTSYDVPIDNTSYVATLTALQNKIKTDFPDDQQVISATNNTTYDVYGRDKLYKIVNSQYVASTKFEENVPYYIKVTNTGSEMQPQVDTQEISIMLPSIGNSIAKMWDLIYGGTDLNGGQYRNTTIKWLDGTTYFRHNGLRLIPSVDYGLGYDTNAVSTLAGAINSTHDLMGMIIRTRPDNVTPDTDDLTNLSSAYIYYYPSMGKYYRLGTTYKWSDTSVTTYDATTKNDSPYFVEQVIGSNENQLQPWPDPNTQYFYIEPIEETREEINGQWVFKSDYLLEQNYYPGWQYYSVFTPTDDDKVTVGRTFKENVYYEYMQNYPVTYTDNEGNKITTTANSYIISKDLVANPNHHYFTITDRVPVGDNYRFFEYEADDITHQFYIITNWREATETDPLDTTGTAPQIKITEATYNLAPQKYYIYDAATDEYIHTTEGYNNDPNVLYYMPAEFQSVTSIEQFRNLINNGTTTYYTIEAKKVSTTQMYVQQISYQKLDAGIVTDDNFANLTVYIKQGNDYIEAVSYSASTTYYTKITSWVLTEVPRQITAENATAVKLLDPTETMTGGYPKYYYYLPIGTSGLPEYYGVNNNIVNKYTYQIVTFTATQNTGFYMPNTLYYRIESGPFAGSWVLDRNKEPTQDRQYYQEHFTTTKIEHKFYSDLDYYFAPEDLNENTVYKTSDGTLYKYSPLFVYEDNNSNPAFKKGDKWNMNVSLTASDNIVLRQYEEVKSMVELVGFARSMSTMNGSISRINEYMSANDTYTRSRRNFAGTINTMNDIIDVFKDIKANELLVSNKYGQIYSRGITLTSDAWITFTEDRSTDQNNWQITVQHKDVDNVTENNTQGNQTTYSVTATQTPNFGATFDILTDVKRDAKGHLHTVGTTTVKIPLPSLTEQISWTNPETASVITDFDLSPTTGEFSYYKKDVGTLLLTQYQNDTAANYPTAGHIIEAANSINTAFANIETYIANSDLSNSAEINKYITSLTQTDGRIAYSLTTLINSSADIVDDNTNKAKTAVSGQAVRQAINDLDSNCSFAVTVANGEYVTGYGIEIEDGLIKSGATTKMDTGTFLGVVTDETTSLVAPQAVAVATYVLGKFSDTETNNTASTASYITSLSQGTNGKISYETTTLLTTVSDMTAVATAGYATSGTAVMAGIDNLCSSELSAGAGNWVSGIKMENHQLKIVTSAFYSGTINSSTAAGNATPPTTEAVESYVSGLLNNTLASWGGTSNIVTLGTIANGTWNGTPITDSYIDTEISAEKIGTTDHDVLSAAYIRPDRVVGVNGHNRLDSSVILPAERIFGIALSDKVDAIGEPPVPTYPLLTLLTTVPNGEVYDTYNEDDTIISLIRKLTTRISELESQVAALTPEPEP